MKYIRLFFLVSAVALTLNMFSVTAHAAETETETELQTVTQEASEDSSTQESNNKNDVYYVVFVGSALFGSLVALGFWITFKS